MLPPTDAPLFGVPWRTEIAIPVLGEHQLCSEPWTWRSNFLRVCVARVGLMLENLRSVHHHVFLIIT
jgi:hypothetical protein